MTPRERIRAALQHRSPDRVPFSWGFGTTPEMGRSMDMFCREQGLSWSRLRAETNDKQGIGPTYKGPPIPDGNIGTGIWGIQLKDADYGRGHYQEFTGFPLAGASTLREIEAHPWPNADDWEYGHVRAELRDRDPNRERAVQCGAGNPFELYSWMTGIEESLVNVLLHPELVLAALDRITTFLVEKLRRTLEVCGDEVDIVFYADDLGSQTGLLMSRESYRRVIQPSHRRITETVRGLAPQARCMMHSDGAVFDIIPDLIDAGLDVLEAVQTDAAGMDVVRLKQTYGRDIAFHGALSVQQLLPNGDAATVEQECRRIVEVLGAGGGYIAAPSHAIQIGTPPENVLAMLRGVLGEADYQAALERSRL